MEEDENPFSLRLSKEQEPKEAEQTAVRKSKLSLVHKKSKSLLN